MIDVFRKTMPHLARAISELGRRFGEPVFIPDESYPRYRHADQSSRLAAYMKGVKIVSALNACLSLLDGGFVHELGILFRTIDEANEGIVFILGPNSDGDLPAPVRRFLADFFKEEFSDPRNPLDSTQKRDRVGRKAVRAENARTAGDIVNPSDGAELQRTIDQAMSGYVHGAYPTIMELYGGDPPRFHLDGMGDTPVQRAWILSARDYYYRGILIVMMLSQAFGSEKVLAELTKTRASFEKETGIDATTDAAEMIRRERSKRNG